MSQLNFFQQLLGRNDPVFRSVERAIELMEEKDYDGALEELRGRALNRRPDDRRALLHMGVVHMLKGDLEEAEKYLRPIAEESRLDSEKAAACIALERVAALRKERGE